LQANKSRISWNVSEDKERSLGDSFDAE